MGIGPLVAWRRASLALARPHVRLARRRSALATGGLLLVARRRLVAARPRRLHLLGLRPGHRSRYEFARGTSARHATAHEGWGSALLVADRPQPPALRRLHRPCRHRAARHRRRRLERLRHEARGGAAHARRLDGRRRLPPTYRETVDRQGDNAVERRALITVQRRGDDLGTLEPARTRYLAEQQVSREVAIRSDLLTGEDLFLNADDFPRGGGVRLEASVKPLVNLIWLAGLVFLLGSAVVMWPDAREQRRLALRYAQAPAAVRP